MRPAIRKWVRIIEGAGKRIADNIEGSARAWRVVCLAILGAALIFRLGLVSNQGYQFDIECYKQWGESAYKWGLVESYHRQVNEGMLPNYPPLTVVIFSLIFGLQKAVSPIVQLPGEFFYKLPAIIFDIIGGIVLYWICKRVYSKKIGLLAIVIWLLNPVVWYDSSVWGQTDSIYTVFLLTATAFLMGKRPFWGGLMLGLAVLVKVQAIVFLPIILLIEWKNLKKEGLKTAISFVLPILVFAILFVIKKDLATFTAIYSKSVGFYNNLTANAYNLWWLFYSDKGTEVVDTLKLFNLISYRQLGLLLFASVFFIIGKWLWRERTTIGKRKQMLTFFSLSIISYAFFLFNTQMHERYIYPLVAFSIPLIFSVKGMFRIYILVSLLVFMNLVGVLPFTPFDKALYSEFPNLDGIIAGGNLLIFFVLGRCYLNKYKIER